MGRTRVSVAEAGLKSVGTCVKEAQAVPAAIQELMDHADPFAGERVESR